MASIMVVYDPYINSEFLLSLLFRRNFDWRKNDVVSTYFVRRNFDKRKIKVVSTCFVRPNFDEQRNGRCFDVFFDAILMEK